MTKTLAPSSIVNHLDPKFRKPFSILEAQWDKAALSEEEAQRVNEASGLADLIAGFIAKNRSSNQFANEEVKSNYGYPKGYQRKDVHAQANLLRELIPGVGFADEKLAELPLPSGAEGYFAIPRWQTIAPTYREAVEKVFALLAKQRKGKFHNYCEGQLGEEYLRESEKTAAAFQKLSDEQKGYDILVVPAQFGMRHRGRSVRRAREVMNASEFGLGAFAVGHHAPHASRAGSTTGTVWTSTVPETSSAPDGGGRFGSAPFFYFRGDGVRFGTRLGGQPATTAMAPRPASVPQ